MRKVAVVIPLFNHEAYIEAAIDSICVQTRPVDRIIVVDDGSSDQGLERVRAINDPRLTVVTQLNAGAHIAINRGVQMANDCDFVAILNSDDVFHPRRIEHCAGFLEENESADVVCTRLELIDNMGVPLDPQEPKARWVRIVWQAPHEDVIDWLGVANVIKTTSNIVGRREYLSSHPFRAYRYVHDYYFALVCALERRLAILPENLLFYRTHQSNTIKFGGTEAVTREVLQMNLDIMRAIAPQMAKSPELRRDFTRYFRVLADNHSDFRAEVFLQFFATLLAGQPEQEISAQIASLNSAGFPELEQPSNKALREMLAREDFRRLQRDAAMSRWVAIGRALGVRMDFLKETGTSFEAKLSSFKKRLDSSRWVRFGRLLGMGPETEDHA